MLEPFLKGRMGGAPSGMRIVLAQLSLLLCIVLSLVGGAGCAARSHQGKDVATEVADRGGRSEATPLVPQRQKTLGQDPKGLLRVNSVYLAPVQFANTARGDARRQEQFNQQLELAAGRKLAVEFITPSDGRARGLSIADNAEPRTRALKSAEQLGLDAVLITTVSTVHDREGGALGAYAPASFGFTMELVRLAGKDSVWSTSYISHDEAISSNLFKLTQKVGPGRTAGWLSLDELASRGFDEALEDLSKRRQSAFVSER